MTLCADAMEKDLTKFLRVISDFGMYDLEADSAGGKCLAMNSLIAKKR